MSHEYYVGFIQAGIQIILLASVSNAYNVALLYVSAKIFLATSEGSKFGNMQSLSPKYLIAISSRG